MCPEPFEEPLLELAGPLLRALVDDEVDVDLELPRADRRVDSGGLTAGLR